MNKELLRKKYLLLRKKIINKELKDKEIYFKTLKDSSFINSNIVGIYVSTKEEVDTLNIIKYALISGKTVAVPVILKGYNMEFYRIFSLDDLDNTNSFGIKEPRNRILVDNIELLLIPGICFDTYNNRIGYGKGYYDKYLERYPNITKIALAYQEQITKDKIDSSEYDISMDKIITDKMIIKKKSL